MGALNVAIRSAARSLLRDRAHVAGIVATLALGIGVVTTLAGVTDSVFLRPLPFADDQRLVIIRNTYGRGAGVTQASSAAPDYRDRVELNRTLESLAAWAPRNVNLTGRGEPIRLRAGRTTASLPATLGVAPIRGRWFTAREDEAQQRLAVLSSRLATSLFGSPASAPGQKLVLGGNAYEVVGVMGPDFDFAPRGAELWVPLGLTAASYANEERGNEYLEIVARVRRGVSIEAAASDMRAIADGVAKRDPSRAEFLAGAGWGAAVIPLRDELFGELKRTSLLLFAFGLVVLLLALVNASQLAVVRAIRRRESMAIREAVGANRTQLAAQIVCEGLLLGLLAAAAGLVVPQVAFAFVRRLAPIEALRELPLRVDLRVALFAFGCAILCALVSSLGPLLASRSALASTLVSGRGAVQSRGAAGLRAVVTAAEVALSVVLVTGGIGVWQQVARLLDVSPGFDARNVTTMRLALPSSRYDEAAARGFARELLARLDASPGIESSALVTSFPMSGEQWTASFAVEGRSGADSAGARIRVISPGYFSLMRIPLREGASFDEEGEGAERRVVIDEAAAERYWPGASAVGRRITFSDDDDAEIVWWTVAGVVGSIRDESLGLSPEPHVYIPHSMHPERGFFVAVRTDGGAGRDVGTLFRDAVRGLDPQLPVWDVVTAEQYLASSLALQRFRLSTLWAFGLTGLTLAALGVYGVVAFAFSLAKGDHAIRLALGATREHLVGLGLRSVARPALAGAAIGVVASAALSELLARILAGVPAWSPAAAAIASLVVAALVALAALLPATMLSNVDPVDALRST